MNWLEIMSQELLAVCNPLLSMHDQTEGISGCWSVISQPSEYFSLILLCKYYSITALEEMMYKDLANSHTSASNDILPTQYFINIIFITWKQQIINT